MGQGNRSFRSLPFCAGALLSAAGAGCILLKGLMPETVDADGFLHEAFFLIPVGFMLLFAGIFLISAGAVIKLLRFSRRRKDPGPTGKKIR